MPNNSVETRQPITIPTHRIPFSEALLVGSERYRKHIKDTAPNSIALTDGRRVETDIAFQTSYLKLLPEGTGVDIFWIGKHVAEKPAQHALTSRLNEKSSVEKSVILLTGGEHLHPETTGSTQAADTFELKKHGGYDRTRDVVGINLLDFASENELPLVGVCRGSQLALNYFSQGHAQPEDHGQADHHHINTPDGYILNRHGVRNILPVDLTRSLDIEIPDVEEVNSAHAQGYTKRSISEGCMKELRKNGLYPWLQATIPGIPDDEQTIEGWIKIGDSGKITGVLTQFHPELQNDQDGRKVRKFIQNMITTHQ